VERLAPFADIVRSEVNVKQVELTTDVAAHGAFQVAVNARVAGPRLGKDVQRAIKAVKAGQWSELPGGGIVADGVELREEEIERRLVSTDPGAAGALPGNSGLVVLDTEVTPELAAEGLARDVIRVVQQARRDAGLEITDRIALTVQAPDEVRSAVQAHEEFVRGETLSQQVSYGTVDGGFAGSVGDGLDVRVAVTKIT